MTGLILIGAALRSASIFLTFTSCFKVVVSTKGTVLAIAGVAIVVIVSIESGSSVMSSPTLSQSALITSIKLRSKLWY